MAQERHLEGAAETEHGKPQPPLEVPVASREVAGSQPAALLQHDDAVTLLHQAKRAHAATKTGTDDQEVSVHEQLLRQRLLIGSRSPVQAQARDPAQQAERGEHHTREELRRHAFEPEQVWTGPRHRETELHRLPAVDGRSLDVVGAGVSVSCGCLADLP